MLIVDDNEIDRNIIANYFAEDFMILEAQSGEECFRILKEYKYNIDIVLLDNWLPDMTGVDILKERKLDQRFADIPVIIVTVNNDSVNLIESFKNGADDYITKPYSPTILLLRIQNIFKRLDNSTEVLKYKDLEVSPSRGTLSGNNKELELTKNEMLIFQHLLNNQNRIVSRDELMTILWNNEEYINDNALTVNISRLRSKLEDFGYPNAIETRKGQGYILL